MKCILVNILNNCFPLRLIAPNIDKFLCEPVIVTTDLESLSIHTLLIKESKKKNDSSSDTAVKSLGRWSTILRALF